MQLAVRFAVGGSDENGGQISRTVYGKVEGESNKGVMVLATVKGDVHDIGKNLVDIILTNNGYRVVNLGIKQPIDDILKALRRNQCDAIGMSGLLVKSTLMMRDNLEIMNERGINVPVILGGAALNRRYVDNDLIPLYNGKFFTRATRSTVSRDGFADAERDSAAENTGKKKQNLPSPKRKRARKPKY
jgi:cobalamin-dependent methionine synthase I